MGVLKAATMLVFLPICAARASMIDAVDSIEFTASEQAGAGNIYNTSGTLDAQFGEEENVFGVTGKARLLYGYQILPADSSDPTNLSVKHSTSWGGGGEVNPVKKMVLGADLDSSTDRFLMLFTDGVKAIFGYEPLRFSYRYARTVLRSDFVSGPQRRPVSHSGGYIYQQTFGLEGTFDLGKRDTLIPSTEYSTFRANIADFESLIEQLPTGALSNMNDTISNFQIWATALSWKREWTDRFDSALSQSVGRVTLTNDLLMITSGQVGYKIRPDFHIAIGWEYSHDPAQIQNLGLIELRYTWVR